MSDEKLEMVKATLGEWALLQELPQEINGFTYKEGGAIEGNLIKLCSYVNEENKRSLHFVYTKETEDYFPVKEVGLHSFRDIKYFTRDKEIFEKNMLEDLSKLLTEIDVNTDVNDKFAVEEIGLKNWEYGAKLEPQIGSYQLFINPRKPVEFINGSIVFIDYSDFENGNQLMIIYNYYKECFFAEIKKHFTPITVHDFDCETLEQLEKLLENNLKEYLEKIN